ncbi:MAG: HDOD domain-containing protein [Pseudomonadales bacterium]|nr:HDOD domain-containing protein [Pseudomonadales bacterium]
MTTLQRMPESGTLDKQDALPSVVHIGRQAILDRELSVYGYEILYRSSTPDAAFRVGADQMSSRSILNTFMEVGIDRVVGDRKVFLNLTRPFFTELPALPVDADRMVLELLEDIEVDDRLIAGVTALRDKGYRIAIDDYRFEEKWEPILPLASIVKVEVDEETMPRMAGAMPRMREHDALLLAEKVETRAQFETLRELGFDLFQGFFFARPELVEQTRLSNNASVILRLISRINDPDVHMGELVELITHDPALSYKILRYVNSPASGILKEVRSIHQAVVMLGLGTIRAWTTLLAMSAFQEKPLELCNLALVRANMCERLSRETGSGDPHEAYTVGLLSILEALLDLPMERLLAELKLPDQISLAIAHRGGVYGAMLDGAMALERANWDVAERIGVSPDVLVEIYAASTEASFRTLKEIAQLR